MECGDINEWQISATELCGFCDISYLTLLVVFLVVVLVGVGVGVGVDIGEIDAAVGS